MQNKIMESITNKLISRKLVDGLYTKANLSFQKHEDYINAVTISNDTINHDLNIPFRVHQALFCLKSTLPLEGDIVELGVGKGYLFSGAIAVFESELRNRNKHVYLVDLFEPFNNKDSKVNQSSLKNYIYADDVDSVIATFSKYDFVNVVQGRCPEILLEIIPKIEQRKISFLHVDLNHHKAEVDSLELLFPLIVSGGIILLDDYANPGRNQQYKAFSEFFDRVKMPILTLGSGQGIVIKR